MLGREGREGEGREGRAVPACWGKRGEYPQAGEREGCARMLGTTLQLHQLNKARDVECLKNEKPYSYRMRNPAV